MRYYYEPPTTYTRGCGQHYICDHPFYKECTLFEKEEKGLAVVQLRYGKMSKSFYWGKIDEWLAYDIYHQNGFSDMFDKYAAKADKNKLYPTLPVRKVMWLLRMKPLPKEWWENSKDFQLL